ncbi:hypothetical protein EDB85DRAFT_214315 [Lactarius pseudohatsudake]|nr:hypothetical protein EDB85DRAFT_214315 [Lactarius pseudohatsudake]
MGSKAMTSNMGGGGGMGGRRWWGRRDAPQDAHDRSETGPGAGMGAAGGGMGGAAGMSMSSAAAAEMGGCLHRVSSWCPCFACLSFLFFLGIAKRLTFIFMTSQSDHILRIPTRANCHDAYDTACVILVPYYILPLFLGESSACLDGSEGKWWLLSSPVVSVHESHGILKKKLGELESLIASCGIYWGLN